MTRLTDGKKTKDIKMKKAIATIETDIGTMTLYYNGENEPITAEQGEIIEECGVLPVPTCLDEAANIISAAYAGMWWGLEWIEE